MRNASSSLLAACTLAASFTSGYAQKAASQPSDEAIASAIKQALAEEDALQGSDISIVPTVRHGVVTLKGYVPNKAAKVLAAQEIDEITGVKRVMNDLVIQEPPLAHNP